MAAIFYTFVGKTQNSPRPFLLVNGEENQDIQEFLWEYNPMTVTQDHEFRSIFKILHFIFLVTKKIWNTLHEGFVSEFTQF